jgi:hypothetical protein
MDTPEKCVGIMTNYSLKMGFNKTKTIVVASASAQK